MISIRAYMKTLKAKKENDQTINTDVRRLIFRRQVIYFLILNLLDIPYCVAAFWSFY